VSGFSADWLALREPADRRARNPNVLAALRTSFAARDAVDVIDLGCGTGSNLRAVALHLPARQRWRLVDHDPALLVAARDPLLAWADSAERGDGDLTLVKDGRELLVSFMQTDLAKDPGVALAGAPDLVTAAALFDLVSVPWIERFAREVGHVRAAFYTALTYAGSESWEPAHAFDAEMLAAFHAHQASDKGFGPSAGPRGTAVLEKEFTALGYAVRTGASPWHLGETEATLVRELADGAAQAVRETGQVPEERVSAWLAARRGGAGCTIGHTDLLALPR
jgi:hypothetical protein